MNTEVAAKLKDAWQAAEKELAGSPLIFMNNEGAYWLNKRAREFISGRGISVKDLMEWLKIGSRHLQTLSYRDMALSMMNLPGGNVVAIIKEKATDEGRSSISLTARERELLRYLVKGHSNKEIASAMKISPGTVNAHLDNIYMKLGCTNRVGACLLALKDGLVLPASEK
jgi:DNA-binding NarL/FixJ family response regulator